RESSYAILEKASRNRSIPIDNTKNSRNLLHISSKKQEGDMHETKINFIPLSAACRFCICMA
ncbi:hypothetical protein, partial [Bacillus spizizenii]|uniref:hypothetical protein n=1 Tax=Bacillus spizizenii TaxID=96241 RepID=UPI001BB127CB